MGALWDLVQAYIDEQPYPPSIARVAAKAGMERGTLGRWQDPVGRLPEARHLRAVADVIEQPYRTVLDAALADAGYLERDEAQPRRTVRMTRPLHVAARDREGDT